MTASHQPYTESIAESSASTLRDSTTEESAESLSTKLSEAHSVIKTLREELALVKQQLTDAMDRNIEYESQVETFAKRISKLRNTYASTAQCRSTAVFNNQGPLTMGSFQQGHGNVKGSINYGNVSNSASGKSWYD